MSTYLTGVDYVFQIMDQLKGLTQQNQLSHSILSECPKFKPNMTRLVTCISAGSLDPLSQASMEFVDGSHPNQQKQLSSAQAFLAKSNHLPSLVHVIQVIIHVYASFLLSISSF